MEQIPNNPFRTVLDDIRKLAPSHIYIDVSTLGLMQAQGLHLAIHNSPFRLRYKSICYFDTLDDIKRDGSILISLGEDSLPKISIIPQNKIIGFAADKYIKGDPKDLKHDAMLNGYIQFKDIIRISTADAAKNCIDIFTVRGKYVKRTTLTQVMKDLPDTFIQVEKREIVNSDFILGTNKIKSIVFMKGMNGSEELETVPVSKNYRDYLINKLNNGLFI